MKQMQIQRSKIRPAGGRGEDQGLNEATDRAVARARIVRERAAAQGQNRRAA